MAWFSPDMGLLAHLLFVRIVSTIEKYPGKAESVQKPQAFIQTQHCIMERKTTFPPLFLCCSALSGGEYTTGFLLVKPTLSRSPEK